MDNIKEPRAKREEADRNGEEARERMELTHAACLLMAADPHLSPDDAVNDVYQIYDHICIRRR